MTFRPLRRDDEFAVHLSLGPVRVRTVRCVESHATNVHDMSFSICPRVASVSDLVTLQHRAPTRAAVAFWDAVLPSLRAMHAAEEWGSWDADGREVAQ